MVSSPGVLPSLARARREIENPPPNLLGEPSKTFAAAAIVVQTNAVRREVWEDQVDMNEALFARYPRGPVPAPKLFGKSWNEPLSTISYKLVPEGSLGTRGACTSCSITAGKTFCPTCDGSGTLAGESVFTCSACNGSGMIPCSMCEGTTVVISTKIRYVNDHTLLLRRAFVPNIGKISAKVQSAIDADASWNPSYAFDPQPQVVASAYRGASAARVPDFHGFHFGDALPRALESIGELTQDRGVAMQETRCFAVPLLWLVYGDVPGTAEHVVVVSRPDTSLACVSA